MGAAHRRFGAARPPLCRSPRRWTAAALWAAAGPGCWCSRQAAAPPTEECTDFSPPTPTAAAGHSCPSATGAGMRCRTPSSCSRTKARAQWTGSADRPVAAAPCPRPPTAKTNAASAPNQGCLRRSLPPVRLGAWRHPAPFASWLSLAPLLLLLVLLQSAQKRHERKQLSAVKASAESPQTPSSAAAAGSLCPWRCGPQNTAVAALEKRQQSEKLPAQRGGYLPSTVDGSN